MNVNDLKRFRNLGIAANAIQCRAEDQYMGMKTCFIGGHLDLDRSGELMEHAAIVYATQSDLIDIYKARLSEMIPTDGMTERQRKILILRYVYGYSFKQVAAQMNYDLRYLYKLHAEAIATLQRIDGKKLMNNTE